MEPCCVAAQIRHRRRTKHDLLSVFYIGEVHPMNRLMKDVLLSEKPALHERQARYFRRFFRAVLCASILSSMGLTAYAGRFEYYDDGYSGYTADLPYSSYIDDSCQANPQYDPYDNYSCQADPPYTLSDPYGYPAYEDYGYYDYQSDGSYGYSESQDEGRHAVWEKTPEPGSAKEENTSSHLIRDFEPVLQMPTLPTGCEIASLAAVLQYYEYDISAEELAKDYLPVTEWELEEDSYGTLRGPDFDLFFVGDPAGTGTVCWSGAIVRAACSFLIANEARVWTYDTTGMRPEQLYSYVDLGIPVITWATISMSDNRLVQEEWYTWDGKKMHWGINDHAVVLIGYSNETVTVSDPLSGIVVYSREAFEKARELRDFQSVMLF